MKYRQLTRWIDTEQFIKFIKVFDREEYESVRIEQKIKMYKKSTRIDMFAVFVNDKKKS